MDKKTIMIGGIVLSLIVVYIIVSKLKSKSKAGEVRTKARAEKIENKTIVGDPSIFNTSYSSTPQSKLLNDTELKDICKDFKKAFRGIGTNESLFFATLDRVKSLPQLAQVKDNYRLLYSDDLQTMMLTELNKAEEQRLAKYLKTL